MDTSYVPNCVSRDSHFLYMALYLGNQVEYLGAYFPNSRSNWVCGVLDSSADGLRRPLLHSPRDLLREDGCDECCLFDVSSRVEAIQLHGQDLLLCEPVEIDVSHARLSALRRLRRLLHRLVITVFSRYA